MERREALRLEGLISDANKTMQFIYVASILALSAIFAILSFVTSSVFLGEISINYRNWSLLISAMVAIISTIALTMEPRRIIEIYSTRFSVERLRKRLESEGLLHRIEDSKINKVNGVLVLQKQPELTGL